MLTNEILEYKQRKYVKYSVVQHKLETYKRR